MMSDYLALPPRETHFPAKTNEVKPSIWGKLSRLSLRAPRMCQAPVSRPPAEPVPLSRGCSR